MAREIVDTEDQIIDAGDSDDTVLVYASGAVVHGGAGEDWLSTNINVTAGPSADPDTATVEYISTELYGDAGDDHIHASMRGINYDLVGLDITARLSGGDGDDQIWLDIFGTGGELSASVSGGVGMDNIRIEKIGQGDIGSGGPVIVDAGGDDDRVKVYSYENSDSVTDARVTVRAGGGNDFVESYCASIGIDSGGGENHLSGGTGNDTLLGTVSGGADFGYGLNEADGGEGNDLITLNGFAGGGDYGQNYNSAVGGAGDDQINVSAYALYGTGSNTVSGGDGNDTVTAEAFFEGGGSGGNVIYGGEGNDQLTATIILGPDPSEDDDLYADGANQIEGGAGDDRLYAIIRVSGKLGDEVDLHSELFGGEGDDRLKVSGGTDNFLTGNQGDDTLLGSTGDDRMIGGQGDDYLRGYAGDDTFEFQSARNGERDRIDGFDPGGDVIDLSRIDANAFRGGNQAFDFDGTGDGGTGRLWLEDFGTKTVLHADTGRAVLDIVLLDSAVTASDYNADSFIL